MNQPKVIIAEDNPMSRIIIGKVIDKLGYKTCLVENGQEAIDIVSTCQPDLVLVDVSMPKLDGYETCRIIREQCAKHIPIIFLSGKTLKEDILKGYEVGGSDFITKPFNHHELARKIKLAVENKLKIDQLTEKSASHKALKEAIAQTEKLKVVEQFIKDSYTCDNYLALLNTLFEMLTHGLGLQSTLQIRLAEFSRIRTHDDIERPLDLRIIESCQDEGQIFHFRVNRALFSYRDFSLLVQNIGEEEGNVSLILDTFELALVRIHTLLNEANMIELTEINLTPWVKHLQIEVGFCFDQLSTKMRLVFGDLVDNDTLTAEIEKRLLHLVEDEKNIALQKMDKFSSG